jgi:hypothetical protein
MAAPTSNASRRSRRAPQKTGVAAGGEVDSAPRRSRRTASRRPARRPRDLPAEVGAQLGDVRARFQMRSSSNSRRSGSGQVERSRPAFRLRLIRPRDRASGRGRHRVETEKGPSKVTATVQRPDGPPSPEPSGGKLPIMTAGTLVSAVPGGGASTCSADDLPVTQCVVRPSFEGEAFVSSSASEATSRCPPRRAPGAAAALPPSRVPTRETAAPYPRPLVDCARPRGASRRSRPRRRHFRLLIG